MVMSPRVLDRACRENAAIVLGRRCVMRNPRSVAEVRSKLGAPPVEMIESLRLLRSFIKLTPRQRRNILKLVERLAIEPSAAPDRPHA